MYFRAAVDYTGQIMLQPWDINIYGPENLQFQFI